MASGAGLATLAAAPASPSKRQVFPLNRKWLYGGKTVEGATAPDFDDRRFERVFGIASLAELPRLDDLGGDVEQIRERLHAVTEQRGA